MPREWDNFEEELHHILGTLGAKAIYKTTHLICESLYDQGQLAYAGDVVSVEEAGRVKDVVYTLLISTSTVAWRMEMQVWLRSALQLFTPRIISAWKKWRTNFKSKTKIASQKLAAAAGIPESTPRKEFPSRPAPKKRASKLSVASDVLSEAGSSALHRPPTIRSRLSSDMESPLYQKLPREMKRSRPPQHESHPHKIMRTRTGAALPLDDMVADLSSIDMTSNQKMELVNQYIVIRDTLSRSSQPLCLVTLTAVVKEEFRTFKRVDICTDHISFDAFK